MKNEFNTFSPANNADDLDRYDPITVMFKERMILVEGQVNTQLSHHIISQLIKLEAMDPDKPIMMIINSPGGSVIDGLAIYDIMRRVTCEIHTIGNGMQASMGSILLAGGDQRSMMPNSMLLVHQIMGGAAGGTQHSDFEISGSFMAQQHEKLKSVYVEFTGLNHKFWDIVGERDSWLTAEQAKKIGFIHEIRHPHKNKRGPFAAEAVRQEMGGLGGVLDKAAKNYISKMTAEQIARAINTGNAEGGVYSRYRGELIVKLAEFPEYWTEAKKLQVAASKKAKNAANQNANQALKP